jgi:putative transposase
MPNYVRWRESGATYLFTVVTDRRRPILAEPVARQALHRAFVEIRRRWPFDMFACALLPDHIHCIWTLPREDDDFPLRWANIKRRFTQVYTSTGGRSLPVSPNRTRHRERGVWQPRYWEHLIRDEHEMLVLRDYIHLNPVKHGYVRDPLDWVWSSVHRHNRMGWLEPDWTSRTPLDIDIVAE